MTVSFQNKNLDFSKGVIFHDFFLSEEIFIPLYRLYYEKKHELIDSTIQELLSLLTSSQFSDAKAVTFAMAEQFQQLWENFQSIVLLNKNPLQLMVIYRGDEEEPSGMNAEFSTILDQKEVEDKIEHHYGRRVYGINTGNDIVKDQMKIIQARGVESFLQRHSSGLLNQLYSTIDTNVAEALHKYHSDILREIYTTSNKSKRQHITGRPWHKIIYGNVQADKWLGNAYEAYFNHMANHEPILFDYLSKHGQGIAATYSYSAQRSVFLEEGGDQQDLGNFPRLMMGQVNSIPWFAGGDIVIINDKLEVIYNIQLKTTTRKSQTVFSEKIKQLRSFLISYNSLDTIEEKAKLLFDNFQNTIANSTMVQQLDNNALPNTIKTIIKTLSIN